MEQFIEALNYAMRPFKITDAEVISEEPYWDIKVRLAMFPNHTFVIQRRAMEYKPQPYTWSDLGYEAGCSFRRIVLPVDDHIVLGEN